MISFNRPVMVIGILFALKTPGSFRERHDAAGPVSCRVNLTYYGPSVISCYKKDDTTYLLRDISKGGGVITLHGDNNNENDYTAKSAEWSLVGKDRFALDAHYGVSLTYDFYKTLFNRNSIDDHGMVLYSYVNDPSNINNALWDGGAMRFGLNAKTGKPVASVDIIGHELTHGVIFFTCRLKSGGESGAINESICDIMGKSIEFWSRPGKQDWIMGDVTGLRVRDLSDPEKFHQPAIYRDSLLWYSGSNAELNDHINCGVGNYMFYLLVQGGQGKRPSNQTYQVHAIGLNKADQVIYRSITHYLQPYSSYADWKSGCLSSARDLFGKHSKEYRSVKEAWEAVGVMTNE